MGVRRVRPLVVPDAIIGGTFGPPNRLVERTRRPPRESQCDPWPKSNNCRSLAVMTNTMNDRRPAAETALATIGRGFDHASLALMPFTMALQKPGEGAPMMCIDEMLTVGDQRRRVAFELHSEDGKALPYAGDHRTYLALLQLSLEIGRASWTQKDSKVV